jgi:hypothetical protein
MAFLNLSPYAAWKNGRFSIQELGDPSVSGDLADPDQDGSPNLVEYTLRTDARWSNEAPVITAMANPGNRHYIDVSFPHNRNATDVQISYEGSPNMINWSPVTPEFVMAVVTDFETEEVTVRVATPPPAFFVRIRITKP